MAIAAPNDGDIGRKEDCNCPIVPEQAAGEIVRVCRYKNPADCQIIIKLKIGNHANEY